MSTATQAREAIESLKGELNRIAGECMLEHKEEIVHLLVDQQEEEGVDSEGRPLRRYTETTRKLKQYAGTYVGYTNLKETGEFHSTLNLSINGDEYSIDSPSTTDAGELKSTKLAMWQGAPIMDLTPENVAKIYPIIEDTFRYRVNQELALD